MNKFFVISIVSLLILGIGAGTASAKSLYVIQSISSSPISAYDIQGNTLVYQFTSPPGNHYGGVGLGIDTDSEILFVTYEGYNTIDIVNAKTLTKMGFVTAPGASNLAGILVDQDKQKVYTMDRSTNKLYVYSWDSVTKTLTLDGGTFKLLPGVYQAHGIALDEVNDLLYIGDLTNAVKVFKTSDWTSAGSFTVSQAAMGIAVDVTNRLVYTGNAYPGYGSLGLLSKYDLNTNTETTLNIRSIPGGVSSDNVLGLSVDPQKGLLYITTGNQGGGGSDRIIVFNSNLNILYATGDIGDPTGIVVPGKEISYNPLNLAKTDGRTAACPGDTLTYTISYDNTNNYPVDNVVITDTLPAGVTYNSNTGGGSHSAGVVTWSLGTIDAGVSGSVSVTVSVNAGTSGTITNSAVIDSDQTPPTTQNDQTNIGGNCDGQIPEFPTVAMPIAAVLGIMFLMSRRKQN